MVKLAGIDEKDTALVLETGLARYKLRDCPCCGKGMGEPKGVDQLVACTGLEWETVDIGETNFELVI